MRAYSLTPADTFFREAPVPCLILLLCGILAAMSLFRAPHPIIRHPSAPARSVTRPVLRMPRPEERTFPALTSDPARHVLRIRLPPQERLRRYTVLSITRNGDCLERRETLIEHQGSSAELEAVEQGRFFFETAEPEPISDPNTDPLVFFITLDVEPLYGHSTQLTSYTLVLAYPEPGSRRERALTIHSCH